MSERTTHEDLMRYLDGELSPDARARVEEAVASSTELRRELAIFEAMKADLHDLSFSPPPEADGLWDRVSKRLARPVGWILLVVGVMLWTGYAAWMFVVSPADLLEKLGVGAVVIGVVLLLASVIWERYQDWLIDPYRDVHR